MSKKAWLAVGIPILLAFLLAVANLRAGLPALALALVYAVAAVAGVGQYMTHTWLRTHPESPRAARVADLIWALVIAFVGLLFVLLSAR